MSAAPSQDAAAKASAAGDKGKKEGDAPKDKKPAALEEDDEFEDFPVESKLRCVPCHQIKRVSRYAAHVLRCSG